MGRVFNRLARLFVVPGFKDTQCGYKLFSARAAEVFSQLRVEGLAFDNYPKIVLYATGLALAWAYIDSPSRARLVALGALIGIGFLFRHDHLVYLGALNATTIALVHHASMRDGFRAAAGLCDTAAILFFPAYTERASRL